VATIEAIEEAGFKPVLCEIDETFNISPEDIRRKTNSKTVAIMPVHMMGAAASIEEIMDFAREKKLRVVEDTCQSTGASLKGKKLGTFGDMGCYSFDYVKVMTTGEGGIVVTDCPELFRQADCYHDHGHPHLPATGRGDEKRARKGFNFRMNEIQGALGIVQLKKLDYIVSRQRENKKAIKDMISKTGGIEFRRLLDSEGDISTFLTLLLPDSERAAKFRDRMKHYGTVPATLNYWHFIANIEIAGGAFPKSEEILSRSVSLEIRTNMGEPEISRIADSIQKSSKDVL
jgi:8-amino-3,8-dideoxy-alpha-D-manno-octulosonate transaminase